MLPLLSGLFSGDFTGLMTEILIDCFLPSNELEGFILFLDLFQSLFMLPKTFKAAFDY